MSNTLLTTSEITFKALEILENQLTFTKQVNRAYDDRFAIGGAKIGATINVRKPARFTPTYGPTLPVQSMVETYVPVTLNKQYTQGVSFTSKDLTLDIDDFADRVLAPQVAVLANQIDYDGLQQYVNIYQQVGTPGTTPTQMLTYLDAGVKLDNSAAPRGTERACVVNPIAQATIVNAYSGLFNPVEEVSRQYTEGTMGRAQGYKWSMDQNVAQQTIGTYAATVGPSGTVTPTTSGQTGSTISLSGWTAGDILNAGDVIQIAGVYSVNPQNYQSTGFLQDFVVTATTTANGSGIMTALPISPAITTSGAYQTVTASPSSSAKVSVYGASGTTTPQNLVFSRDAFTFACADLEIPNGVDMAKRVKSKKLGISMRVVRAYDIFNDGFPMRIDVLGGWATLRPELACRVNG